MENELIPNEQQGNGTIALSGNAAQFIERFLLEIDVAPTSKATYRKALRQFFVWYEARGGGDLSRADILAYKQEQMERIQATTVASYLAALRAFFKWLESEKLYPNVAAGVKGTKLARGHRKDALTPSQVGRVLEMLKGNTLLAKRNYALFNLLVRTGLRTIEVERANIEDMRNKGTATVVRARKRALGQRRVRRLDGRRGTADIRVSSRAAGFRKRAGAAGFAAFRLPLHSDVRQSPRRTQPTRNREEHASSRRIRRRSPYHPLAQTYLDKLIALGRCEHPAGAAARAALEHQHDAYLRTQFGSRRQRGGA